MINLLLKKGVMMYKIAKGLLMMALLGACAANAARTQFYGQKKVDQEKELALKKELYEKEKKIEKELDWKKQLYEKKGIEKKDKSAVEKWKEYKEKYPLHAAVKEANPVNDAKKTENFFQLLEALSFNDKNLLAEDSDGKWAIFYSTKGDVIKFLAPRMLVVLTKKNDLGGIKKLFAGVKYSFDPNLNTDDEGNTPLHIAISNQNYPIVDFLLKNGADPFAKNVSQTTAIDWAEILSEDSLTAKKIAQRLAQYKQ